MAIPDVRLTGQLFDLFLSGYVNPKLSLYCAMEDLSTGHQLMVYAFNTYQKDFIPTSLYLRWQVTFQTLFITVKVMQAQRYPCTYANWGFNRPRTCFPSPAP